MNGEILLLIPMHNEAENVPALRKELEEELAGMPRQVVVVNDGSTDRTGEELARCPGWEVISTDRVGKSMALKMGLERAGRHGVVVMMDGDLQDDAASIPHLVSEIRNGAACVVGCRKERKDCAWNKMFPSRCFNLFLSLLFGFRFRDINSGLKAFDADYLNRIPWFEGCHRFLPLLVYRLGGKVAQYEVRHRPRYAGKSKFNSPWRFLTGIAQACLIRAGHYDRPLPAVEQARGTALLGLALAVFSIGLFYGAALEWPFARHDAPAFMPQALRYALDGELINSLQPTAKLWDPTGLGRTVGHGFLPAMVTGSLMWAPTYSALQWVYAFYGALGLAVLALLLQRYTLIGEKAGWGDVLLACLVLGFAARIWDRSSGRPENFVFMLALLGLAAWLKSSLSFRPWIAGFILSLLALSSPLAALFSGTLYLAYLAWAFKPAAAIRLLLYGGAAGLLGLVLGFVWYPYTAYEWWEGHLRHAQVAVIDTAPIFTLSLTAWIFEPMRGLRGLVLLAGMTGLAVWAWQHRGQAKQRWAVLGLGLIFVLEIWYFCLRQGFPIYNCEWLAALGLLPLLIILQKSSLPSWGRRVAMASVAGMLFFGNLLWFKENLVRHTSVREGMTANVLRHKLDALRAAHPAGGYIARDFFQLADENEGLELYDVQIVPSPGQFLLLSQDELSTYRPPEIAGWKLSEDQFKSTPLTWLGLPLTKAARGFYYAVYVADDSATAVSRKPPVTSQGKANEARNQ